jgi:large subunit ribosomal protein L21
MYAIVETGGKQYRVTPGDVFRVEKLPVERGGTVELAQVLLIADDEAMTVGAPLVDGAKVVCTVIEQDRAKKIMAIRYKPQKNVRVKRGHRQYYSALRVDRIER